MIDNFHLIIDNQERILEELNKTLDEMSKCTDMNHILELNYDFNRLFLIAKDFLNIEEKVKIVRMHDKYKKQFLGIKVRQ